MTDRLVERFAAEVRRATRWAPGDDPFPVLEALGHAVVLHLVGSLDEVMADHGAGLRALAPAALAAARAFPGHSGSSAQPGSSDLPGFSDDFDDTEAYRHGAQLAALGLRLLEGLPPDDLGRYPGDAEDPTDRRIVRMLRGELDGVSAAACAVRCLVLRDPRPALLFRLDRLTAAEDRAFVEPMRLAAADPAQVRSPDEGHVVGTLEDTLLEAVYFAAEGQLAIYAASPVFLQIIAEGLTPRDVKPGYWLGDVAPGAPLALALEVHVDGRVVRWTVHCEG